MLFYFVLFAGRVTWFVTGGVPLSRFLVAMPAAQVLLSLRESPSLDVVRFLPVVFGQLFRVIRDASLPAAVATFTTLIRLCVSINPSFVHSHAALNHFVANIMDFSDLHEKLVRTILLAFGTTAAADDRSAMVRFSWFYFGVILRSMQVTSGTR